MNVDIYFKQLKYQKVEQTKAYEVLDFLSEYIQFINIYSANCLIVTNEVLFKHKVCVIYFTLYNYLHIASGSCNRYMEKPFAYRKLHKAKNRNC